MKKKYGVKARYLPSSKEDVPQNYAYEGRIGILGDFHFDSKKPGEYQKRSPVMINAGNFDGLLEALAPVISIDLTSETVKLEFTSMNDFSNEALTEKIEKLKELALIKEYLVNAKSQIGLQKVTDSTAVKKLVEVIKATGS